MCMVVAACCLIGFSAVQLFLTTARSGILCPMSINTYASLPEEAVYPIDWPFMTWRREYELKMKRSIKRADLTRQVKGSESTRTAALDLHYYYVAFLGFRASESAAASRECPLEAIVLAHSIHLTLQSCVAITNLQFYKCYCRSAEVCIVKQVRLLTFR